MELGERGLAVLCAVRGDPGQLTVLLGAEHASFCGVPGYGPRPALAGPLEFGVTQVRLLGNVSLVVGGTGPGVQGGDRGEVGCLCGSDHGKGNAPGPSAVPGASQCGSRRYFFSQAAIIFWAMGAASLPPPISERSVSEFSITTATAICLPSCLP